MASGDVAPDNVDARHEGSSRFPEQGKRMGPSLSGALRMFGVPSSGGDAPDNTTAEKLSRTTGVADGAATTAEHFVGVDQWDPNELWADETTVMIRNISYHLSKTKVIKELQAQGFRGQFDFVAVPRRTGRINLGYAFVNFHTRDWAKLCHEMYHGRMFGRTSGPRACEVVPANRQRHAQQLQAEGFVVSDSAPADLSGHDGGRSPTDSALRLTDSDTSSAGTHPGSWPAPADVDGRTTGSWSTQASRGPSRTTRPAEAAHPGRISIPPLPRRPHPFPTFAPPAHAAPAGPAPAREAYPQRYPHHIEGLVLRF